MARGVSPNTPWTSDICSQCGRQVEILNGDYQFSMELHMQSHKSLDKINKDYERQLREDALRSKENEGHTSPDCKVYNVAAPLQQHASKYPPYNGAAVCEGQLPKSSYKSKDVDSKMSTNDITEPLKLSILDGIFETMPPGLKSHRSFIHENNNGKVSCNICNTTIDHIFRVPEHLKTKLHEDNALLFLTKLVPDSLLQMLDFVSFYGSNLCCNLCRCKIDMSSSNPHETIVNIMGHNTSKTHLNKKSGSETDEQSNEAAFIINTLAKLNPLIRENKHFIECKMQPRFNCSLCDKMVPYGQNETDLLKNFDVHLNSTYHNKSLKVTSVLQQFQLSQPYDKVKHNFIISKHSIYCTICDCPIEADIEKLVLHLNEASNSAPVVHSTDLKNEIKYNNELCSVNSTAQVSMQNETNLKSILNSLPEELRNTRFLYECGPGHILCSVCNCKIPQSVYNIRTHLMGNNHKGNENKLKSAAKNQNNDIIILPKDPTVNQTLHTFNKVYELLLTTDPLILKHSKVFEKYEDGKFYKCLLCGALVQASSNFNIFERNFISHITSHSHQCKFNNHNSLPVIIETQSALVKELFKFLPIHLINNIQHIKASSSEVNSLHCSLCSAKVAAHVNCLQEHLEGRTHMSSLQKFELENLDTSVFDDVVLNNIMKTEQEIKSAMKYLIKEDEHNILCKVCDCTMSRSNDEQSFRTNLLNHVIGLRHKKNVDTALAELIKKLYL